MWREEQRQFSRRRHSPRSTTHRRKTARRPLVFQGSSQSSYNDSSSLHGRLLLLLRLALPLCSPRLHREFAVPTTTPTFLPSALSHLRGYVHCVSV